MGEINGLGLSNIVWLRDSVVKAAQILMKKANPPMSGLLSVVLSNTMSFDIQSWGVGANNNHGHWLTISTLASNYLQVQVCNSAYISCPTTCKA